MGLLWDCCGKNSDKHLNLINHHHSADGPRWRHVDPHQTNAIVMIVHNTGGILLVHLRTFPGGTKPPASSEEWKKVMNLWSDSREKRVAGVQLEFIHNVFAGRQFSFYLGSFCCSQVVAIFHLLSSVSAQDLTKTHCIPL